MMPSEQKKQQPTQEPIEKTPAFLMHLEDRTEHIRSMIDSFVRQFEEMDTREKTAFVTRIQETMNALISQVLGLARTRGAYDELRRELAYHLKPRSWNDEAGKFDYGRYVASLNNALSAMQVFLERNQMLLTFQPIPADFSEQLIEGILDDMKVIAEEEARKALEERHALQMKRFHELEAAGKLTPERLALLSPEERQMLEDFALSEFDEELDELGEESPEEDGVKMDDSVESETDDSEQSEDDESVPEINKTEVGDE